MTTRRETLKLVATFLAGFAVGGVTIRELMPKVVEKYGEVPKVEEAKREAGAVAGIPKFKAAFIYVGPIGDMGWTYGHDRGRKYVERVLPFVETAYVESVPETEVMRYIDKFVDEGYHIIFTTSFGYMKPTKEAARKYEDRFFAHCSGYLEPGDPPNFAEYFIDLYEAYYLNGLAAGAMTKSNVLGYVAGYLIPEVIRHIDAFVIGAREANPKVSLDVIEIGAWYNPDMARKAAETLIGGGADVLAFTEDSATVLQVAEEYQRKGKPVWSFSHYSDMHKFGPTAHLTGQLVNWGPMYVEMVIRAYIAWITGVREVWSEWPPERPRDYWWSMKQSTPSFDWTKNPSDIYTPLSESIPAEVRDYILKRREQVMYGVFDPFTGPVKDREGRTRVPLDERTGKGIRLSKDQLYEVDWFVEGVRSVAKA